MEYLFAEPKHAISISGFMVDRTAGDEPTTKHYKEKEIVLEDLEDAEAVAITYIRQIIPGDAKGYAWSADGALHKKIEAEDYYFYININRDIFDREGAEFLFPNILGVK